MSPKSLIGIGIAGLVLIIIALGAKMMQPGQRIEAKFELSSPAVISEGEKQGLGKESVISLREQFDGKMMPLALQMGTGVNCGISDSATYYLPNTVSQVECWLEGSGTVWIARIKDRHNLEVVSSALTTPVEMKDTPKLTGELKSIYTFVGEPNTDISSLK